MTVFTAVQQKFASNDLEGSWTVSRVSHEQMEMCVQTAREFILKALEKSCLLPVSEQVWMKKTLCADINSKHLILVPTNKSFYESV